MKTLKIPVSNKAYGQLADVSKRDLSQAVLNYIQSLPVSSNGLVSIDVQPANDGRRLTQKDWIAYFNGQKRQMISSPDVYRAVSQKDALESLRKDFDADWEVTSTRILYNPDLSGKVVHNFGSTVAKPTELAVAEIPDYSNGTSVKAVVEGKGLAYARALFQTKDKPVQILKTLEQLSQKAPEQIIFWTPSQRSRNEVSERAVRCCYGNGRFHVSGDIYYDGSNGLSRGVRVNSEPKARTK